MKNSYRIITKFSYKNKQYFIILSNENKIAYVVYENKKVITDIDKQDLNILNFVYNSLKIDKDSSIELGTKELYGKKFEFFYDINKKLYYWCEIINNKRKLADEEDNQKLNFRYNNMPIVLYNNQESENSENQGNNKKKSFINRLLTYKDRTLLVLVAAGISLNLISRCSFAKDEYNPRQEGMQSSFGITEQYELDLFKKKEKFDYGKIQKAIEDNQNLSNGEKEIINKLKFVFDENYEYMDLDLIIKRLSDLKIEYIEEENENSQVTAAYYINKNVIQIYKATDLENADLTDLVHEILHVFQASNTNRLTLELSNELTTREVLRRLNEEGLIEENYQFLNSINEYSNYGKGYEPCIRAEYLLANILPRDVIKAYQFKPEDAILLAALLNITEESEQKESKQDSLNRACDLLDSIDELVTYDESGNIKISYTDEKYKRIYDQINYYYKIENGITMEESLKADIFKYDARYSNVQYGTSEESIQAAEITFIDYIRDKGATSTVFGMDRYVLPKTYLSDEHKNPIIMFKVPLEDERVEKIEITEDLEKKYRDNYKKCKELRWGYNRD